MSGWMIRASLSAPEGSSALRADFRVAIGDEAEAIAAVRALLGETCSLKLRAMSQISDHTLASLGIEAGKVKARHGR